MRGVLKQPAVTVIVVWKKISYVQFVYISFAEFQKKMLTRALLLGIFFVFGAHSYYGEQLEVVDNPLSHRSHWNWGLHDLYGSESRKELSQAREAEDLSDSEREPLAPDYKDPVKPKDEKKNKPKPHPSYDPSVLPGGVVDVDASSLGFPNGFPHIPDPFGLGSSFGNRPGGLFGLGGFLGPINEPKPWWKGVNVCIEREETTDDEDSDTKTPKPKQQENSDHVPNFFSTSISLSNCHQTASKYECITKINNHGVVKTFVVRYKCCYGYKRTEDSAGCTKQIELSPLIKTIENIGGKEFKNMITSAGLEDKFTNENLTVLVPSDDALMDYNDNMEELNQVSAARRRRQVKNPVSSKDLVLNHVLPGFVDLSEVVNEQVLYSENNNNSIRFNIYPTRGYGKMVTANCARVRKEDNLATNGIAHVVEGVLNPVSQSVLDIIAEHPQLSNLNKVLQSTNLTKNFKPNGHYTVFAPTNAAFDKLQESARQGLLRADACAATILKHHIVAHTVCSSAILGNATTHNVDSEIVNLQRTEDDVLLFENTAKITKHDIVGTNGVVHLVDTIVMPESAMYISQALKYENFTKFQNLINQAGLSEEIDGMKNVTIFAPSDEAFEGPEASKLLNEIKDDKEKLKQLIMYHTVQGKIESCDMNNNVQLKSYDDDKTLRLNLYSTLPVFTNIINRATVNCARLTGYDQKLCGSVIHEVNKVLVPPTKNLLDTISSDENYSLFSQILKGTDVEEFLKDSTQSLTVLAPSDEIFNKLDPAELKSLIEDKKKGAMLLKNHILTEVLCCSGVGPHTWGLNTVIPTLSHQHQSVGRTGNVIHVGNAAITQCDSLATNGIIHKINKILYPQQPRTPGFGFFLFDI